MHNKLQEGKMKILILKKNLAFAVRLIAIFCLALYSVANADIEHSGLSSYEDSNQDWNGDGELDGCDKNGDPFGDNLLTWHVADGVHFGSFTVDKGYTLTIEPGAIVKFYLTTGYYASGLEVHGTLIADGTPGEKIVFTSIRDDSYGGDTNNDGDETVPAPGNWGHIGFDSTSVGCILDNTIIQYTGVDYYVWGNHYYVNQAIYIGDCSPTISNNLIQYGAYDGIYCSNSSATISGNTISNLSWSGISCNNSSKPIISENTIMENVNGIYSGSSSNPLINNNNIYNNTNYGVYNADGSLTINAENNWWGDISGPYDPTDGSPDYNPDGKGDRVSDYVSYRSWRNQTMVGIEEDTTKYIAAPEVFSLLQNYPNPFNPVTSIKYSLLKASEVSIIIYNVAGQEVATLCKKFQNPGWYSVNWDASSVGSGVYFYRIVAGEYTSVRKCIVLK
jgi:parallel beta-helix repeat protein